MPKLKFDQSGERLYETGISDVVLYPMGTTGKYGDGIAWNGITSIAENPSGGEPTALYADNIKYLNLMSTEEFSATVEAYMYPDEFEACDGTAELATGISIGQQKRNVFGLAYKTLIGNDTDGTDHGYKLHLVYGCLAKPSGKSYSTVNNSPEAISFSWEMSTTPVSVTGHKPTSSVVIDSTKISKKKLAAIEEKLYGVDADSTTNPAVTDGKPTLLLPDEITALIATITDN